MKKNSCFRRILVAIIAASMVMAYTSCASSDSNSSSADNNSENILSSSSEQASDEQTSQEQISDDVETVDYNGKNFTVLLRDEAEHYREITADELTGEIINDAIYGRTQRVEERFNINIDTVLVSEGDLNNTFQNAVTAGDNSFHMAMQHMIYTATLAANNITLNWYDVPNINFDKPWWTSSTEALTVNDRMYVAVSDLCLNTFEMSWCLVFNKQMLENYKLDDPYQMVRDGTWTLDAYYNLVKGISQDINGDSVMDENDQYGLNSYGAPWLASIGNYWWACGETISKFDENGKPYFAMDNERTYIIFDKLYQLLCEDDIAYWDKTEGKDLIFWKGQSLFASMMIRDVEVNRDKDLQYGLVPYPKYDEAQEKYYSLVDGHSSVMCLPVTLSEEDAAFTGAMVEVLSAETYNSVMPAYYETAMQIKFAQDETFPEMLDLIRQGRVFNFGYVYDTAINRDIIVNLITSKSTALASKLASAEKITNKYYEKIIELYSEE